MLAWKTDFTEVIKEKGIENVTVEDLVAGVTPKGRGRILLSIYYQLLMYQGQGYLVINYLPVILTSNVACVSQPWCLTV